MRNGGRKESCNKKQKVVKEHIIRVRWLHYDLPKKTFVQQKTGLGFTWWMLLLMENRKTQRQLWLVGHYHYLQCLSGKALSHKQAEQHVRQVHLMLTAIYPRGCDIIAITDSQGSRVWQWAKPLLEGKKKTRNNNFLPVTFWRNFWSLQRTSSTTGIQYTMWTNMWYSLWRSSTPTCTPGSQSCANSTRQMSGAGSCVKWKKGCGLTMK